MKINVIMVSLLFLACFESEKDGYGPVDMRILPGVWEEVKYPDRISIIDVAPGSPEISSAQGNDRRVEERDTWITVRDFSCRNSECLQLNLKFCILDRDTLFDDVGLGTLEYAVTRLTENDLAFNGVLWYRRVTEKALVDTTGGQFIVVYPKPDTMGTP